MRQDVTSLDALLRPRSVAVVGASDNRTRIGGRTLGFMLDAPFAGALHAVNPKHARVQGLSAQPSLEAVGEPVDVAVLAVPAHAVEQQIESCGACGVRAAVVFAAGYAEVGEAGLAAQASLAAKAGEAGVRLLGPNCLGAWNARAGFYGTFSSSLSLGLPRAGAVALASQSGAGAAEIAFRARRRGLDVGYFVTTGNEGDVQLAECIAWLSAQDDVRVILATLEGARDGRALYDALCLARDRGKAVLVLKVGRSEVGAAAAASHTAALAGSDAVYDGVLAQAGALRMADVESMLDGAVALVHGRRMDSARVGLLTISGGVGIQMADEAARVGLDVAPMPAPTQARLKALLPYASTRNPVDVTAQFFNQLDLLPAFFDALLDDGEYGAVVAFYAYVAGVPDVEPALRAALAATMARHPERLVVLCLSGDDAMLARYATCGCLVFEDPSRALRALAVLNHFRREYRRAPEAAEPPTVLAVPPNSAVHGGIPSPEAHAMHGPTGELDEHAAKRWLAAAGLPVVNETLARTPAEAQAAAASIGYPVVLKLCAAGLAHKSEVGGVLLGIADADALARAWTTLAERAVAANIHLAGMIVAREERDGVEMILGAQRDPTFGALVMVGLGGTLAEVFADVSFRVAPVDASEARAMLESLTGRALLDGVRGEPAADAEALVDAIVQLSRVATASAGQLSSIDINPMLVRRRGRGAVALDAYIT